MTKPPPRASKKPRIPQDSENNDGDGEQRERGWEFWIDRGGTFTDLVAKRPDGVLLTRKLLSDNPQHYADAAIQGIRDILQLEARESISSKRLDAVKMGTTVATNALLERTGDRTCLLITQGFGDALRIAYQDRPRLFDRHIVLPELLHERVVEIVERVGADGTVLNPLDLEKARQGLEQAHGDGIRACAIVLVHGYRYPAHERALSAMARKIGFSQISVSHEVSPLIKLVGRGDTTVVDAYLSPILRRYVDRIASELGSSQLFFMQSNGGLTRADRWSGKDSILSGPAGGIVGAARTSAAGGFERVITFDMGGTSTDVALYNGTLERAFETTVAGVRMRVPMMRIHTVAAGGGSILHFHSGRYRVGPDSAGASPGPACYRNGGELTVTDCNVTLGRIVPDFFPAVFGKNGKQPLDARIAEEQFREQTHEIYRETGDPRTPNQVAEGFLRVAVENMASAIKQISIGRGHDVTEYALCTFGGAGGQHACLVADTLGMSKIFVHPMAGVLSAYGMGLADMRVLLDHSIEAPLSPRLEKTLGKELQRLAERGRDNLKSQGVAEREIRVSRRVHVRYEGSDTALVVAFGPCPQIIAEFERAHRQAFGFVMPDKGLIVENVAIEAVGQSDSTVDPEVEVPPRTDPLQPLARVSMVSSGKECVDTPVYKREMLVPGDRIPGPAIISEKGATTVVDLGWEAELNRRLHLILTRVEPRPEREAVGTHADPVMLEVFNNLFMSIAEQMGVVLANTAHSVNIKERRDFSCALFDQEGQLIANAPHMPVHLGSMGESVRAILQASSLKQVGALQPGDVYLQNAPYNGGTHLPDMTVVTPVFDRHNHPLFFVASRGHHADIGGITPGSRPPSSTTVHEEGVMFENFKLVEAGSFREEAFLEALGRDPHPARNPRQNIADVQAQIAANEKGVAELQKMLAHFGDEVVLAYMSHVQDNAEESVRRVLDVLHDGAFVYEMDDGAEIRVAITIDKKKREAVIDFTGTSGEQMSNFNAPLAVCKAAVLYVFRTLISDDIPLNEGCLVPLQIIVPEGSMLRPRYPRAVVAGNVETSQCIADALYGALGVLAASQGTMNNFTFGNDRYQYYETVCGGSGAGPDFDGTAAVQTHMTNSRLTDPEVLESRYPVRVEHFGIRRGSGGQGRHRGGDGVTRRIRFEEPMTAAILSNHRRVAPFGLQGGRPGDVGRNYVERTDGTIMELGARAEVTLEAGDVFVIETPGGGGFGRHR